MFKVDLFVHGTGRWLNQESRQSLAIVSLTL